MTVELYHQHHRGSFTLKLRVRVYGLPENSSTKRFCVRVGHEQQPWFETAYSETPRKRILHPEDSTSYSASYSHQFLCIVPMMITVREAKAMIHLHFCKLYPEEGPIKVLRLRDEMDCDLDDDYSIAELFSSDTVVLAVCQNLITDHHHHQVAPEPVRSVFTPLSHTEEITTAYKDLSTPNPICDPQVVKEEHVQAAPRKIAKPNGVARKKKSSSEAAALALVEEKPKAILKPQVSAPVEEKSAKITRKPSQSKKMKQQDSEISVTETAYTSQATAIATGKVVNDEIREEEMTKSEPVTTSVEVHYPRPLHVAPVLLLPKDASEMASVIRADSDSNSDSDESSSDDDEPAVIPIPRSESITALTSAIIQPQLETTNDDDSSSESDDETDNETLAFTQPRASLTELTLELRNQSSGPQAIKTKAMQAVDKQPDDLKKNRSRPNVRRKQ